MRTVKPSGDEVQDAGYGLTRDDYVRLVATVPTISKAIPMRIIPAIEFRNQDAEDRRPAGRHDARLRRRDAAGGRSRAVPVRCRRRRANATTACWRPRWRSELFPIGEAVGQEVLVDERFLPGRRRDEAADGVGRHRRLAGGREFLERHLRPDHARSGGATGT